ncbi:LexA/Signal peptidase [Rhizodiscina lignyota]|uniref:LexA/Signal peptidase n=1 Tax=Rhizodiscina lignyota TaxID=1504668 RepID=A0A9P4IJV4_9PEZI|nr:LexA/Signal peptidase [Rhizodiscina lignyota]
MATRSILGKIRSLNPLRNWIVPKIVLRLAGAGIVTHVILSHGFDVVSPYGISMLPTSAHDGDWILLDKTKRRGRNIKVGDVISFKHPIMPYYGLKRVIAMPGDFVLAGSPDAKGGELEGQMMQVPDGHCFVAGDNQKFSRDSRIFGPLPLALIQGKVTMFLWPLHSFGPPKGGLQDPES